MGDGWRKVVSQAVLLGVPTPCFSTALSFYDGYRCKKLPANFIQAQRDYFGAHTYELLEARRVCAHQLDRDGGQCFSVNLLRLKRKRRLKQPSLSCLYGCAVPA